MENKNVNELDVIALARELGKKIQQEDVFIKYMLAKQNADNDPDLQKSLKEFGDKREELSDESGKPEDKKDPKRIQEISREMNRCYAAIMTNQSMMNYSEAKDNYDVLMNRVNAIIQKSFEGEDPATADYVPNCTGSCATCGGCG